MKFQPTTPEGLAWRIKSAKDLKEATKLIDNYVQLQIKEQKIVEHLKELHLRDATPKQ